MSAERCECGRAMPDAPPQNHAPYCLRHVPTVERGDEAERWITREHALACARNVARRGGYAIAVHGSLQKDLDLIAVPWTDEASGPAEELVESIAIALDWIYGPREDKPHGRKGWTLVPHSTAPKGRGVDAWYIDLSVIEPPDPAPEQDREAEQVVVRLTREEAEGVRFRTRDDSVSPSLVASARAKLDAALSDTAEQKGKR